MYPLLAPFVWLFIVIVLTSVTVIDKCFAYRNAVINKTSLWSLPTSTVIVVLMTILGYNATLILFDGIVHRAIIQTMTTGIISVFLIVTFLFSLTGMAKRVRAKLIDFVENI